MGFLRCKNGELSTIQKVTNSNQRRLRATAVVLAGHFGQNSMTFRGPLFDPVPQFFGYLLW